MVEKHLRPERWVCLQVGLTLNTQLELTDLDGARPSSLRARALICCAVLMGCGELAAPNDTCLTVGLCDDPFECLPEGEAPFVPMSPPPKLVNYVVPIIDSTVPNPEVALPGLTINACLDMDPACDPLPAIVSPVPGQPAAVTSILLPYLPTTSLRLRLQATDYMDALYHFGGPLIGAPTPENPAGDTFELTVPPQLAPLIDEDPGAVLTLPVVRGEPIAMVPREKLDDFFQGIGQSRDETTGIIALRMMNCDIDRTPAVSLDLQADLGDGFGFVVQANNLPVPSVPSDLAGPTVPGDAGGAGFANVPPRNYSPIGVLRDGRTYGGIVGFSVLPNTITYGEVRPGAEMGYPYGR